MTPLQRAGVLLGGILVLCCGGVTGIGAIGATSDKPAADLSAADVPIPSSTSSSTPATPATSAAPATPAVEKRTVTETKKVPFKSRTVRDPNLEKGSKQTRTEGAAGVRTLTYEITLTDGKQTAKRLLSNKVTQQPTTKVIVIGTMSEPEPEPESDCDPNYSGCVPVDSDVDCSGGSGNGPSYVSGVVKVTGSDIYDLDRDNDGYGCD
ncbi:G5 domain-containing protein [Actinoplanes sp. NBRC 103695]|uniref:G5 domain-containing protein n=1 Tax=Actinoplanes sp. NBRC 103695 TaxID=3032202 RepID=UPI00255326CC|nr:G5 domain-containing protein [Actinoplanes sp. NBRC 103695]